MLTIITVSVFISVSLLTAALLYPFLARGSIVKERLEKLSTQKSETTSYSLIKEKTPLQLFLARMGSKISHSSKEQSKYTKLLLAAGYRKESLYIFLGSKILLAAVLPAVFIFVYALPKGALVQMQSMLYVVMFAIIGYLIPSYLIHRKAESRKLLMFQTLPDILDLLTVCVEAGLSIDAAMIRASESPQFRGNPLAGEVKVAAMETRAGKPRPEALKDMAERTSLEDIKSFVMMLVQTEKFGTSLSQALRIHSDTLRTKRRQYAEEAAAKTAIKLLLPLVFFVFPALLVVILGPALFKIRLLFQQ